MYDILSLHLFRESRSDQRKSRLFVLQESLICPGSMLFRELYLREQFPAENGFQLRTSLHCSCCTMRDLRLQLFLILENCKDSVTVTNRGVIYQRQRGHLCTASNLSSFSAKCVPFGLSVLRSCHFYRLRHRQPKLKMESAKRSSRSSCPFWPLKMPAFLISWKNSFSSGKFIRGCKIFE